MSALPSALYITPEQLAERPGALELAQVASDAHCPVVDAQLLEATLRGSDRSAWSAQELAWADAAAQRINDAVEQAQATVDGFLALRGYILPLQSVPGIVSGWTRAIARYLLHQHRLGSEERDPIVRDWRDALRMLQLLAAGKFSLGADDAALRGVDAVGAAQGVDVRFAAPAPVFGRSQLREYR